MSRRIIVCFLAVLLLAIPGCKKASEKFSEKLVEKALEQGGAKNADVDLSKGSVKITSKSGDKESTFEMAGNGKGIELPKDFPQDVPVYPGAKPNASVTQGDQGFFTVFQSPDEPQKIYDFYLGEMKGGGWEVVQEVKSAGLFMVSLKKEKRATHVNVAPNNDKGGGSTISITYQAQAG